MIAMLGLAAAMTAFMAIRELPELARYLRMRRL
jgi:hypothetical protein